MGRKQRQIAAQIEELRAVFQELDTSGDGFLTLDEFVAAFDDPLMLTWATYLEIDTHDLESMFYMLDDGDGKVYVDEFLFGVQHTKGAAKGSDVITVVKILKRIDDKTNKFLRA